MQALNYTAHICSCEKFVKQNHAHNPYYKSMQPILYFNPLVNKLDFLGGLDAFWTSLHAQWAVPPGAEAMASIPGVVF